MNKFFGRLSQLFALWTVLGTALAWIYPPAFLWFLRDANGANWAMRFNFVEPGLGLIMLGMGLTLTLRDFGDILKTPRGVFAGVAAQFLIMPLLGWGIALAFSLPPELATGLILVSCCPGGTASNVIAYLARANVALSVLMTLCSTCAAIVLTPYLTQFLAGTYMAIDALALLKSTLTVVGLPLVAGLFLNRFAPKATAVAKPVMPLLSTLVIVLIVGAIVAKQKAAILEHFGVLMLAVFLLHFGGFLLGYLSGKALRFDTAICRTLSIEVGMQNSGLGSALATKHLGGLTPVPAAISAVYHCLIGSLLAAIWGRLAAAAERQTQRADQQE
ncbi:MAG: bile acid:sodium symporter family protein [Verrucomicrobiales bacterium]